MSKSDPLCVVYTKQLGKNQYYEVVCQKDFSARLPSELEMDSFQ